MGSLAVKCDATYSLHMKVVQVSLDETLLEQPDASSQVRERGRSAIVRDALRAWLAIQREEPIAAAYARAYRKDGGIDDEFPGWATQGASVDLARGIGPSALSARRRRRCLGGPAKRKAPRRASR